ncbi:hypothetical protein [Rhodoplanes azumiensis]|uniref:Uncharacterized protein n=1 Tax=Rhodoplanes azumiensis TaxID=1897628 RepID=A0ABW5AJJ2_9BRAD
MPFIIFLSYDGGFDLAACDTVIIALQHENGKSETTRTRYGAAPIGGSIRQPLGGARR